jgi:hypothetical protein
MNTKRQLRIRYLNCLLQFNFAHVVKFYKRQFYSRQPLYNKIVVEFKNNWMFFMLKIKASYPLYIFFADKLNLSTNYFGIW